MKKAITFIAALAMVGQLTPFLASAETVSTKQQQLQALLQQVQALQSQMAQLKTQQQTVVSQLTTALREGNQGENVKILQALLAADPSIYPEGLITGYFGKATSKAVKRFQQKHGLEQVGSVGPKTLKKLNDLDENEQISFEDVKSAVGKAARSICAKVPPGHFIAPGWLRKNGGAPVLPSCQTLPSGIANNPNLPGASTSTPSSTSDTTAPGISNMAAVVSANSATITWLTNEPADSQIAYGTSTSYGSLTSLDTSLVLNHSVVITGLGMGTVYHYAVKSKDASGNLATSPDQSFTTASDAVSPTISSLSVVPAATSVGFSFQTSELATINLYYSTSNPVVSNATGTLVASSSVLKTSQNFTVGGLATSTAYYYLIEASDAANNKATTTGSFTTLTQ